MTILCEAFSADHHFGAESECFVVQRVLSHPLVARDIPRCGRILGMKAGEPVEVPAAGRPLTH